MATNPGSGGADVFDVRKIRRLVELMNEHELTEIDLRQADQRVRLRRGPECVSLPGVPAPLAVGGAAAPRQPAAELPTVVAEDASAVYVKSPMVGTFYVAANPESASFVKVGDQVGPDTTVCIVEAMKVFNEIPAGCSGKITACLVENGEPVEFGQPLFKVEKIT